MEHGALVLPHVDVEPRQEVEHVHQEMLVERNVRDLCLKLDHAVVPSVSFLFFLLFFIQINRQKFIKNRPST